MFFHYFKLLFPWIIAVLVVFWIVSGITGFFSEFYGSLTRLRQF